jgi:hypothetical protein
MENNKNVKLKNFFRLIYNLYQNEKDEIYSNTHIFFFYSNTLDRNKLNNMLIDETKRNQLCDFFLFIRNELTLNNTEIEMSLDNICTYEKLFEKYDLFIQLLNDVKNYFLNSLESDLIEHIFYKKISIDLEIKNRFNENVNNKITNLRINNKIDILIAFMNSLIDKYNVICNSLKKNCINSSFELNFYCTFLKYNLCKNFESIFKRFEELTTKYNNLNMLYNENLSYVQIINNLYVNSDNKCYYINPLSINNDIINAIYKQFNSHNIYMTNLNISHFVVHVGTSNNNEYCDVYLYNNKLPNTYIQIHISFHNDGLNIEAQKSHINTYCVDNMNSKVNIQNIIDNDGKILRDVKIFNSQGIDVSENTNNKKILCFDFCTKYLYEKNDIDEQTKNIFKILVDRQITLYKFIEQNETIVELKNYTGIKCVSFNDCILYNVNDILKIIIKNIIEPYVLYYKININNNYNLYFLNNSNNILYLKNVYNINIV